MTRTPTYGFGIGFGSVTRAVGKRRQSGSTDPSPRARWAVSGRDGGHAIRAAGRAATLGILLFSTAVVRAGTASDVLEDFAFYGSLRGHVATFEGDVEVQDNSARVGIDFRRNFGRGPAIVARAEWSLNLFKSDFQFNADGVTDTGFAVITREQTGQVFGTRLGYLGVDFGKAGQILIGKQWSVYHDLSCWTDGFDVFGTQASGTYSPTGTDGGGAGTGRAQNSVTYRVATGRVSIGVQGQFRSADLGESTVDSLGAAVGVEIVEGLSAGAAWNRIAIDPSVFTLVRGLDGDATYLAAALKFERGPWTAAVLYARETNGDFFTVPDDATVIYGATGWEAFARRRLGKSFEVAAGFNLRSPETADPAISPDFRLRYAVVNARYFLDPSTYAYAELKLDDGISAAGKPGFDVFLVGLRFDFSLKKKSSP